MEKGLSKEVSISEATGELTNVMVDWWPKVKHQRSLWDAQKMKVDRMTSVVLHSHLRGGRSSALVH